MAEIARLRRMYDTMVGYSPSPEVARNLALRIKGLSLGLTAQEVQDRIHWMNLGWDEEFLNSQGVSYAGL
jgi:hypothetical protein